MAIFQSESILNDAVNFRTQVRDANRQYEFNYNGEVDNGMLIAAQATTEDHRSQNKADSGIKK